MPICCRFVAARVCEATKRCLSGKKLIRHFICGREPASGTGQSNSIPGLAADWGLDVFPSLSVDGTWPISLREGNSSNCHSALSAAFHHSAATLSEALFLSSMAYRADASSKLGYSDVADALGLSYDAVRSWSIGRTTPNEEDRAALADFFDQRADTLRDVAAELRETTKEE